MRTYLGKRRKTFREFPGDDPGLQRAQADPFDPFHAGDLPHQIQQILPLLSRPPQIASSCQIIPVRLPDKIHPVGADVDPCEHHLPAACRGQKAHLPQYVFRLSAAHPPPRIGDDAVGAELVAAVLDLQISPRMILRKPFFRYGLFLLRQHFLVIPLPVHIGHTSVIQRFFCRGVRRLPVCRLPVPPRGLTLPGSRLLLRDSCLSALPAFFPFLQEFLQKLRQILLPVVSHGKIDALIQKRLLLPGLHIAANGHHHRVRIPFFRTMQHLPALSVRDIRHRARIYDINIRFAIEWYNPVSLFL